MKITSPHQFLQAIFGDNETVCCTRLRQTGTPTQVRRSAHAFERWTRSEKLREAWYFCISTVKEPPPREGEDVPVRIQRRKVDFVATYCIVLDDIGTKVDKDLITLPPTWIAETSPGNFQYGYLLETPCTDIGLVEGLIAGLADAGLTDAGSKDAMHIFRLPGSLNLKNDFETKVAWHGHAYSVDQVRMGTAPGAVRQRVMRTAVDVAPIDMVVEDILLPWLVENQDGVDHGGAWIDVTCPNAAEHTDPTAVTAGYSPLGRGDGEWVMTRGFKCMHEHCAKIHFKEFMDLLDRSAPFCTGYDPMPWLQYRFGMVADGELIVDMYARTSRKWMYKKGEIGMLPGWSGKVATPGRKDPVLISTAFREHRDTKRYNTFGYLPGNDIDIVAGDQVYCNTWVPVEHPETDTQPVEFLAHLAHLIPDDATRETFMDWLAYKVQHPEGRSYAVMMVTDGVQGVGRSTLGDIMCAVWKNQGRTITFGALLGKGTSQEETWNSWMSGAQFVVVDEAKDVSDVYHAYERFKTRFDTRPGPMEIKRKGRDDTSEMVYYVPLIFSNHLDALVVDGNDRRLHIIENPGTALEPSEGKRRYEHMMANEIPAIFHFLKRRDVSNFNSSKAPESEAKGNMIDMSLSPWDIVMERIRDEAVGDLIAKDDFEDAWDSMCAREEVSQEVKRQRSRQWSRLRRISDQKGGHKMRFGETLVRVRALRNFKVWKAKLEQEGVGQCVFEAAKNRKPSRLGGFGRPRD